MPFGFNYLLEVVILKMINYLKSLIKSELFTRSLTLLILINIGNFLNYMYQFSMARMLSPINYGILATLTNIIYIFQVPTISIQTVVSKYTTKFSVKKEFGKIKGIFDYLIKKVLLIALIIFIIFSISSIFLSKSLNISIWLLILTGTFLFGAFLYSIGIGILQGMKKFKVWGWNFILGNIIKLTLAITLVFLGFKVYGAIIGFVFGTVFAFIFIIPFIKEIVHAEETKEKVNIISKDSLSTFLAMLLIVLMYSIDVILAKGFFTSDIVGKYAVISMIGKMILFGTITIGYVMFPISSEKFVSGNKTKKLLKKTFIAVFLLCALAITLFTFFPELIIKILFGDQYLSLAGILVYIGIAFSFISFLNIFILYKISVDKFKLKQIMFLFIFLVTQITILFLIHSTIQEYSIALMFSTIITFIGSLILIK